MQNAGLSRADLLRALAVVGEEAQHDIAALLDFVPQRRTAQHMAIEIVVPPSVPEQEIAASTASAPALPTTKRQPLRMPMFGITKAEAVEEEGEKEAQQADLLPLTTADFAPRKASRLHPQALLPSATQTRRLREQLSQKGDGRKLAIPRLVNMLACAQMPTRLPRQDWPYAPGHVCVLVDRSQHLRPYWHDQDQLVHVLANWIGAGNLTTYTVQGDPWQIQATWSRGRVLHNVPSLCALPSDHLVLLLSDSAALRVGANHAAQRAHWQQASDLLAAKGARVLACPPCAQQDLIKTNEAMQLLLTLLSCARRIEPELLRAVRKLHPLTANAPGLEAQIWSSHAQFEIGYDVCVWRSKRVLAYRQKFAQLDAAMQIAVLHTMLAVHGVRGRAIEVQETLVWASHVPPAVRQQKEEEIQAASTWLKRLGANKNTMQNPPPGLVAFAEQRWGFHGVDDAVIGQYDFAFAPLWAISESAAKQRSAPSVPAGVLPLALQKRLRGQALPDEKRWILQQQERQLLLAEKLLPNASPMGMPLDMRAATLTWRDRLSQAWLGQQNIDDFTAERCVLAELSEGQTLHLHTNRLRLTLDIVMPEIKEVLAIKLNQPNAISASICQLEQGRDEYGMYLDLAIYGVTQRMRYIEPGQFLMGSPKNEAGRFDDEGPQQRVVIAEGFWLADTACTQALWQAVMGKNPSHFHEKNHGSPQHPVEQVSWHDAQGFLQRLAKLLPDFATRLPTEAQWEYACRAGTTTPFSFGAHCSSEQANFNGNYPYGTARKGKYRAQTVAVQEFAANPWGLYQMHGNVWEWCEDVWRKNYAQAHDAGNKELRVLRGGSWFSFAQLARSAFRYRLEPDGRGSDVGFRFVLRSSRQLGP